MGSSIRISPSGKQIAAELRRRGSALTPAIAALGTSHAGRGEAYAKQNAPWNDRSGNARQGLFGVSEAEGTIVTLTFGGSTDYQKYLEDGTSKMPAYPIIRPTTQKVAPEFAADAAQVVARILGGK